jgi:hypothetical protein
MEKPLVLIAALLLLPGCSLFPTKVTEPTVVYKNIPISCAAPKPQPIVPLDVTIEVIEDTKGIWWVALGDLSYKNLAINNQEVNRYIKDLQVHSDTLKNCIEDSKND